MRVRVCVRVCTRVYTYIFTDRASSPRPAPETLLVAVVLQVLLVAVLLEQGVRVAAGQPVGVLHHGVRALGFHLLPLPSPRHWG